VIIKSSQSAPMNNPYRKITLECPPGSESEALRVATDFLAHPEWHAPVANRKVVGFRRGDNVYSAWGYRWVVCVARCVAAERPDE
jgi:hypothetical protein